MSKTSQLNIDNFPSELKKKLKIFCASKGDDGISVKEFVILAITKELVAQKKQK